MFYWVVGLVGGFCAQNSTAKMIHTCIKTKRFLSLGVNVTILEKLGLKKKKVFLFLCQF